MLHGQRMAIDPHDNERQLVARFVETQCLEVGPGIPRRGSLPRQVRRIVEADEVDVAGRGEGLEPVDQGPEGIAGPGDLHCPALDAAEPVEALLQGKAGEEILQVEHAGSLDPARHRHLPAVEGEFPSQVPHPVLGSRELVKVVVARRDLFGRELALAERMGFVALGREAVGEAVADRRIEHSPAGKVRAKGIGKAAGRAESESQRPEAEAGQHLPAVEVDRFGRGQMLGNAPGGGDVDSRHGSTAAVDDRRPLVRSTAGGG